MEHLETLVDLYLRGVREPLAIACETSAAYAGAEWEGLDPIAAAGSAWTTGFGKFDKEDADPEHVLVYGPQHPISELLGEPARADEGWEEADPSRFGRYARRLWFPLLEREVISQR